MTTDLRATRGRDTGRVPYRFTAAGVLALGEHLRGDAELWGGVLDRMVKKETPKDIVSQVADLLRPVITCGRRRLDATATGHSPSRTSPRRAGGGLSSSPIPLRSTGWR